MVDPEGLEVLPPFNLGAEPSRTLISHKILQIIPPQVVFTKDHRGNKSLARRRVAGSHQTWESNIVVILFDEPGKAELAYEGLEKLENEANIISSEFG